MWVQLNVQVTEELKRQLHCLAKGRELLFQTSIRQILQKEVNDNLPLIRQTLQQEVDVNLTTIADMKARKEQP